MRWRCQIAVVLGLAAVAVGTHAQPYSIDWFTTAGGGGISGGGGYSLSGTIGQPATGTAASGQYTVEEGFWPGIVVPPDGELPTLFIQASANVVVVSWATAASGFALEESLDLAGASWTAGPTGNPVTIPVTGVARFFRLRKP